MTEPRHLVSWPAAKFRAVARACLVAASTDAERPHLCGVFFRRKNAVLSATATDGHWLLRWTEPEGQTNEAGDTIDRSAFECLIPRRVLESFVGATKKHLELERVNLVARSHDSASRELETILDERRFEFLPVPETFPPTDEVIPTTVAPSVSSIAVGANMLTKVARAFALATGDQETTVFWQFSGDKESPLVCTSETHGELLAIVMPRRAEGANAVPETKEAAE